MTAVLRACGPTVRDHRNDGLPPTIADIEQRIAAGESCALLFEARNRLDPKSPDIEIVAGMAGALALGRRSSR